MLFKQKEVGLLLKIVTLGEEILREKASLISDINEETSWLAERMIEILETGAGVGLAAPQVGEGKRLFVTKAPGDIPRVFINPEIIFTSQEQVKFEEGCLSIPGVYADVIRPSGITIQAWNLTGKHFRLDADDYLARIIQHEYDHLNGILFPDRLKEKQRERVLTIYEKKSRG